MGSGKARTWNDLGRAVFSAMNLADKIEYIEMPKNLQGQYQYFTEATMDKMRKAGYTKEFWSLEDGITDYVQNYLISEKYF